MIRWLLALLVLAVLPGFASAAGGGAAYEHANINLSNQASLQRGARNFVNYCMGCHSAQYVRYNRLAEDVGLSEDQMVTNLMWAAEKPHETMEIAMPGSDAERWFGVTPPDLSLIARARGKDYLYTFLKGFYLDDTRPAGVNNIALPGASMPHVLWELQGLRRAQIEPGAPRRRPSRQGQILRARQGADAHPRPPRVRHSCSSSSRIRNRAVRPTTARLARVPENSSRQIACTRSGVTRSIPLRISPRRN